MRINRALVALTLGLTLTLSGCSNDDDGSASDGGSSRGETSATAHNDADVAFATQMMQHHAQALQMVDMTVGRDLDPEFEELTEAIRAAQGPEIETMSDWLQDWDEEVPATVRDHVNSDDGHSEGMDGMEGMDDTGMGMPGMMSQDEMNALEDAPDSGFQDMWLTMMIQHHEGATEMAATEQSEGQYAPAVDLADDIAAAQTAEIETMRALLS